MPDEALSSREADRIFETTRAAERAAVNAVEQRWEQAQREDQIHRGGHERDHDRHLAIHEQEHAHDREVNRLVEAQLAIAFSSHTREHDSAEEAIKTALQAVKELAGLHNVAHTREHTAHEVRHEDARLAIMKADTVLDKRLVDLNGVYGQMRDQQRTLATAEALGLLQEAVLRGREDERREREQRHEELRVRIDNIEKGDVKQEGKTLGQGATVAMIVGAIAFVGTVLGIVVALVGVVT